MSDQGFTAGGDWMQLWQEWFDSMNRLAQPETGEDGNPFSQFLAGLTPFSMNADPATAQSLPGAAAFVQFGEYMQRFLEAGAEPGNTAGLQNAFMQIGEEALRLSAMWGQAGSGGSAAAPFAQLLQPFKQLFGDSMPDLQAILSAGLQPPVAEFDISGVNNPSYGPTREWEELSKRLYRARGRLERARFGIGQRYQKVVFTALLQFHRGLQSADGELDSLKAVYDYWVDLAEQAYHNEVMTDDYARDFAELINSQSELKRVTNEMLSRLQETLNLPNRREIDELIRRNAALEEKLESLAEADRDQSALEALKTEVAELRERLARPTLSAVPAIQTAAPATGSTAPVAQMADRTKGDNRSNKTKTKAEKKETATDKPVKKPKRRKPKSTQKPRDEFGISRISDAS